MERPVTPWQPNKTMKTETNDGLLRLEYEVEGVTEKTLMFGLCYLPPSAQRRHNRNGIPLAKQIQSQSTPSFCKHESLYKTREEAQFRSAMPEMPPSSAVKNTCTSSSVGPSRSWNANRSCRHAATISTQKSAATMTWRPRSLSRLRGASELDAELENINRDFFGK